MAPKVRPWELPTRDTIDGERRVAALHVFIIDGKFR